MIFKKNFNFLTLNSLIIDLNYVKTGFLFDHIIFDEFQNLFRRVSNFAFNELPDCQKSLFYRKPVPPKIVLKTGFIGIIVFSEHLFCQKLSKTSFVNTNLSYRKQFLPIIYFLSKNRFISIFLSKTGSSAFCSIENRFCKHWCEVSNESITNLATSALPLTESDSDSPIAIVVKAAVK